MSGDEPRSPPRALDEPSVPTGSEALPSGGVLVWKPAGPTSRRVLDEAERVLGCGPLGHTGTLDPLAEGLLLLLGGEARKFQALLTDHDKRYRAEIALGVISATDDAEGPLSCPWPRPRLPDRAEIERALDRFRGGYAQAPPRHSAIHVEGERAWRRTRRGEELELAPRPVRIGRIEVLEIAQPLVRLDIECGPGTYIRSLARDLGDALGTGAHLAALARTGLGGFVEADATPLERLARGAWLPLESILAPLPRLDVPPTLGERLALGQRVPLPGPRDERPEAGLRVIWCEGVVAGLGEVKAGIIQPRRWRSAR